MQDKVDVRNRKLQMQGNLIKWWNVYETPDSDLSLMGNTVDNLQGLEEDERELLALIMNENDHSNVYDKTKYALNGATEAGNDSETENSDTGNMDQQLLEEANAIYNRLMQEAAEDQALLEKEIEEVKRLAQG